VRDFATSRGASEVKWLESNRERKNQRDPLAWTALEQTSKQDWIDQATKLQQDWKDSRGKKQPDEIGGVATSLKWRVPPRLRVVTSATSTKGSGTTATCEREESLEAAAGDLVLHAATTHKSY